MTVAGIEFETGRTAPVPGVTYCDSAYSCAANADARVIGTEWEQFRALDLSRLKREMAQTVIVDLRNIYRPDEMAEHGFTYESVGRPADPRLRDGGPYDRRTGHRRQR